MQVKLRAKGINFVFVVAASYCTSSPHSCLFPMYYTFYIHSCNAAAAVIAKTTLIHVHFCVFKAVIFSFSLLFSCVVTVLSWCIHFHCCWQRKALSSAQLLTSASCNYFSSFHRLPLRFFSSFNVLNAIFM